MECDHMLYFFFYTDVMYRQYKYDVIHVDVYRLEAFKENYNPL